MEISLALARLDSKTAGAEHQVKTTMLRELIYFE